MTCGKGCNTVDQASHNNYSTDLDIICYASSGPCKARSIITTANCQVLASIAILMFITGQPVILVMFTVCPQGLAEMSIQKMLVV